MRSEKRRLAPGSERAGKGVFARHFAEMVVVMLAGMGVLEGLAALAFGVAGSSLASQSGTFRVALMGVSMTVPMVAWMSFRGHSWRRNAEMAGSMVIPSALAALLVAGGAIGLGAALALQHAVMVPAMLGVMLWRYEEYSASHSSAGPAVIARSPAPRPQRSGPSV